MSGVNVTEACVVALGRATDKIAASEPGRSEEDEQKAALINQVLELQNTLDGTEARRANSHIADISA